MQAVQTLVFVCALALAGCSSIRTNVDYDQSWDFSTLRTFHLLTPPGYATGNPEEPGDPLTHQRIMNALRSDLLSKGYREAQESPDFAVAFHVGSQDKVEVTNWGYAYGPRGAYWGVGSPGIDVYQYQEGTLIVDIVDARSNKLIWRGTARRVLDANPTPEERTQTVNAAVAKILADFPPPKSENSDQK